MEWILIGILEGGACAPPDIGAATLALATRPATLHPRQPRAGAPVGVARPIEEEGTPASVAALCSGAVAAAAVTMAA